MEAAKPLTRLSSLRLKILSGEQNIDALAGDAQPSPQNQQQQQYNQYNQQYQQQQQYNQYNQQYNVQQNGPPGPKKPPQPYNNYDLMTPLPTVSSNSSRKGSLSSTSAMNKLFRRNKSGALFDEEQGADIGELTNGANVSFDDIKHLRDRNPFGKSLDTTPIIPTLGGGIGNASGRGGSNVQYRKQMNHLKKLALAQGARANSLAGQPQYQQDPRAMSLSSYGPRAMSMNLGPMGPNQGPNQGPRAMSLRQGPPQFHGQHPQGPPGQFQGPPGQFHGKPGQFHGQPGQFQGQPQFQGPPGQFQGQPNYGPRSASMVNRGNPYLRSNSLVSGPNGPHGFQPNGQNASNGFLPNGPNAPNGFNQNGFQNAPNGLNGAGLKLNTNLPQNGYLQNGNLQNGQSPNGQLQNGPPGPRSMSLTSSPLGPPQNGHGPSPFITGFQGINLGSQSQGPSPITAPNGTSLAQGRTVSPPPLTNTNYSSQLSNDSLQNVMEEAEEEDVKALYSKAANMSSSSKKEESDAIYKFDEAEEDGLLRKSTLKASNSVRLRKLNLFGAEPTRAAYSSLNPETVETPKKSVPKRKQPKFAEPIHPEVVQEEKPPVPEKEPPKVRGIMLSDTRAEPSDERSFNVKSKRQSVLTDESDLQRSGSWKSDSNTEKFRLLGALAGTSKDIFVTANDLNISGGSRSEIQSESGSGSSESESESDSEDELTMAEISKTNSGGSNVTSGSLDTFTQAPRRLEGGFPRSRSIHSIVANTAFSNFRNKDEDGTRSIRSGSVGSANSSFSGSVYKTGSKDDNISRTVSGGSANAAYNKSVDSINRSAVNESFQALEPIDEPYSPIDMVHPINSPLKTEHLQSDTAKSVQAEPVQHEQVQSESVEHEQMQPESVEHEQMQPESVEHEQVQSESVEHEQMQPESVEHEQVQPELVQREQVQREQVQPEQVQREQVQPEWTKSESREIETEDLNELPSEHLAIIPVLAYVEPVNHDSDDGSSVYGSPSPQDRHVHNLADDLEYDSDVVPDFNTYRDEDDISPVISRSADPFAYDTSVSPGNETPASKESSVSPINKSPVPFKLMVSAVVPVVDGQIGEPLRPISEIKLNKSVEVETPNRSYESPSRSVSVASSLSSLTRASSIVALNRGSSTYSQSRVGDVDEDKKKLRPFSLSSTKKLFRRLSKNTNEDEKKEAKRPSQLDLLTKTVLPNTLQEEYSPMISPVASVSTIPRLTFTKEELRIMNVNNDLLDEMELVTTELAQCIKRELSLEMRMKNSSGNSSDVENAYQIAQKLHIISELQEKLNLERRKRILSEEYVILLEQGQKPSYLQLSYEKDEIYKQLLNQSDYVTQMQDKIEEYENRNNLRDDQNLLDKYNDLLKEVTDLKFRVIPELEEKNKKLGKLKKNHNVNNGSHKQLSLVHKSDAESTRIESSDEFESEEDDRASPMYDESQETISRLNIQRDELRDVVSQLTLNHNHELKLANDKIKILEGKFKDVKSINDMLSRRGQGSDHAGGKLHGFSIVDPNKRAF